MIGKLFKLVGIGYVFVVVPLLLVEAFQTGNYGKLFLVPAMFIGLLILGFIVQSLYRFFGNRFG